MFNEELDLGEPVEEKDGVGSSRKAEGQAHHMDQIKQEMTSPGIVTDIRTLQNSSCASSLILNTVKAAFLYQSLIKIVKVNTHLESISQCSTSRKRTQGPM